VRERPLKYYVADVFTDRPFGGNPAGVCLLEDWPDDGLMQSIAAENNLSETAFLVRREDRYSLRWFTPELEIDLCGHATMGSAFVLFEYLERDAAELRFETRSGVLTVAKGEDGLLWMDLPSRPGAPAPNFPCLRGALGIARFDTYKSADILVVLENEDEVGNLAPDFAKLKPLKDEAGMSGDDFGVIVTARGSETSGCDFVSRFFAPGAGINEDPVTGRAHCVLIPYWAKRLGKASMTARQLSRRGGRLWCEDAGERVRIGGKAKLYLTGEIWV